jgi:hypothetical protein
MRAPAYLRPARPGSATPLWGFSSRASSPLEEMATTVPYPGPDLFSAICLGKTRRIRETLEQMIGPNVARKGAPTHQMVAGVVAISLRKLRELWRKLMSLDGLRDDNSSKAIGFKCALRMIGLRTCDTENKFKYRTGAKRPMSTYIEQNR